MLVVSNVDLTTEISIVKPSVFLESSIKDFTLNINNDYRYLKTGYYVSLHAEVLGSPVIPSSEKIIDASRTPILLLRAKKAGIPALSWVVTDSVKKIISEFTFPVVIFPVNPFIYEGYGIANNKSALYRAMKSLGINYKFPVCVQSLQGEMLSFKSIFGNCGQNENTKKVAHNVYALFKIPVCKLHVQIVGEKAYLCGLQPLKKSELCKSDLELISKETLLLSKKGEPLVD